jgi:Bacterial Ig-like domain
MVGTVTSAFTTGTGVDLIPPTIGPVTPADKTQNVLTTTNITVAFSKAMDAISFNPSTSLVLQDSTGVTVPATIALSTNLATATLHPTAPLNHGITYTVFVTFSATQQTCRETR